MIFIMKYFTFCFLLDYVVGYRMYNALDSIIFTTNELPPEDIHSEYYFGKCAAKEKVLLVKHVFHYEDLKDKLITRARLSVIKEPTCIYLRAKSEFSEIIRYHAFKFNICICLLIYNYGGRRFQHFYYEWYTPVEMMKGIVWELYFYK